MILNMPSDQTSDLTARWYEDFFFAGVLIQQFAVSGDERIPHGNPTFLPRDAGREVIQLATSRYEGSHDVDVIPVFRENEEQKIRKQARILREALSACVEWDAYMGFWENSCWENARAALEATREGV